MNYLAPPTMKFVNSIESNEGSKLATVIDIR